MKPLKFLVNMLPLEISIGTVNGYFSLFWLINCCFKSFKIFSICLTASTLLEASTPLGLILSSLMTGLIEMETFLANFGILLRRLVIFSRVWVDIGSGLVSLDFPPTSIVTSIVFSPSFPFFPLTALTAVTS